MDEKTLACHKVYHRLRAAAKADFPHQHTQSCLSRAGGRSPLMVANPGCFYPVTDCRRLRENPARFMGLGKCC
jgi:hypothetical protein